MHTSNQSLDTLELDHTNKQRLPIILADTIERSKWISCPNPWGSRSYMETSDFVLHAPSDYDISNQANDGDKYPKRFTKEPFDQSNIRQAHDENTSISLSTYSLTHNTPQEGYRVIQLVRDRLGLRSWGFQFCCHDFGGACLVESIEPLSPADAAFDVGLGSCHNIQKTKSALSVNDMIIASLVYNNCLLVGGMSMMDLAVELDITTSHLLLVISKYRSTKRTRPSRVQTKVLHPNKDGWESIDNEFQNLHWNEIGPMINTQLSIKRQEIVSLSQNEEMDLFPSNPEFKDHSHLLTSHNNILFSVNSSNEKNSTPYTNEREKNQKMESKTHTNTLDETRFEDETSFAIKSTKLGTEQAISVKESEHGNGIEIVRTSKAVKNYSDCNEKKDPSISNENPIKVMTDFICDVVSQKESDKDNPKNIVTPSFPPEYKGDRSEDEWEDDENPWLGCVCGKTHSSPSTVFWIQCDSCDAWYDVSPKCVGFSENEVDENESWECPACNLSYTKTSTYLAESGKNKTVFLSQTPQISKIREDKVRLKNHGSKSLCPNNQSNIKHINLANESDSSDDDDHSYIKHFTPIPIGSLVNIVDRTWSGVNKPGGVAKILDFKMCKDEDDIFYDVRFILGGKEHKISSRYVSPNQDISCNLASPLSQGTRSRRSRNSIALD